MIDWIKARIAILHEHLPMDRVVKLTPDGELVWEIPTSMSFEGSYSMTVRVRSIDDPVKGVLLEVDGNPLKFLQGHNLFGSNNFRGLLRGVVNKIAVVYPDLNIPQMDPSTTYDIELRRIDITQMYEVGTDAHVQEVLYFLEKYARSRQGRGHPKKNQLLFQKGSRRWSYGFYNKHQELLKHKLPPDISYRNELLDYSKGKLRGELRFLKMEIDDIASDFHTTDIPKIYNAYKERIAVSEAIELDNGKLKQLSRPSRNAFFTWQQGQDVVSALGVSERTFYRYRKEILLKFNVDIAIRKLDADDRSNVITLRKVCFPKPCPEIPDFAKGTNLYYDADLDTKQLQLI